MTRKKYTENDRESLIAYGVTNVAQNAAAMSFDDLVFWLGLGILLARRYVLKATHDRITAWPPMTGEKLPKWEATALRRCGWTEDTESSEEPCAWVSFYAGG